MDCTIPFLIHENTSPHALLTCDWSVLHYALRWHPTRQGDMRSFTIERFALIFLRFLSFSSCEVIAAIDSAA